MNEGLNNFNYFRVRKLCFIYVKDWDDLPFKVLPDGFCKLKHWGLAQWGSYTFIVHHGITIFNNS